MFRSSRIVMTILAFASICLSGCHYAGNRAADFGDIFMLGGGLSAENEVSGPIPLAFGAHVQATDYLGLGANHFSGVSAAVDGRGLYAGPESRTRLSFLFWNWTWLWEDPEAAAENYYKKEGTLWSTRMAGMSHRDRGAKELHNEIIPFEDPALRKHPRGWQYWETFSVELGICEPFVTHLGFHVRAGVDPSEVSDFFLGLFFIDFKRDDLTHEEFEEAQSL